MKSHHFFVIFLLSFSWIYRVYSLLQAWWTFYLRIILLDCCYLLKLSCYYWSYWYFLSNMVTIFLTMRSLDYDFECCMNFYYWLEHHSNITTSFIPVWYPSADWIILSFSINFFYTTTPISDLFIFVLVKLLVFIPTTLFKLYFSTNLQDQSLLVFYSNFLYLTKFTSTTFHALNRMFCFINISLNLLIFSLFSFSLATFMLVEHPLSVHSFSYHQVQQHNRDFLDQF